MYIHWDIEDEVLKNIIVSLSGDLDMERYHKKNAEERLKDAEQEIHMLNNLRDENDELKSEKRELEEKLEGANSVVDDLINDGQQKDAKIKALTDENTALEETIRGLTERIGQSAAAKWLSDKIGQTINYDKIREYAESANVASNVANTNEPE